MIPEFTTERLCLRGLRSDDLDAYARMYADPEVMRFLENGRPLDRAAAFRSMAMHLGHWQLRGYGQWALEDRATGEFVGRAGLWRPEGWPGLEVGWVLERRAWGRGFATEAGRAAIDYAFRRLGAERVISLIQPDNHASIRVAQRLGHRYEGAIEVAGVAVSIFGLPRTDLGSDPYLGHGRSQIGCREQMPGWGVS
jgi:RimJ/RimL family protein N-acetyltransferase